MRIINDQAIEATYVEYGVLYEDGTVYDANSEADARVALEFNSEFDGGARLVARTVYETAWAEVSR